MLSFAVGRQIFWGARASSRRPRVPRWASSPNAFNRAQRPSEKQLVGIAMVLAKDLFGGHSEPRCGNVPLTRTPNTTREDAYAPRKVRRWQHFGIFLREPP